MGDVVQLGSAILQAGPQACSEGTGGFPGSTGQTPLMLLPCQKGYIVTTGFQVMNLNSPSAPVALPGIGTNGTVTQAHTIFIQTTTPTLVVPTYTGVANPTAQRVVGILLIEVDPSNPCTGITVQGQGPVQFAAFGNS
jgi:hypothetical protein